mmetsp:Transcript_23783/g.65972  ORF Transcript_23783/g.65972 Transcript_23783/m.65972 type:complete len:330 (+) Transcript_23783:3212-4201(+)
MNSAAKFAVNLSRGQATRRPFLLRCTTTTRSASTTTAAIGTDGNGGSSRNRTSTEITKSRLARASLKQVPHYGWTQEAITVAASQDPKLSISMSGMFSPSELVGWFMDDMNRQLRKKKEESSTADNEVNQQFESIKWRLEQVLPFVEGGQWHRGMAMGLSTPLTTQSQLHEFIELISPDHSSSAYHTVLGAIFVATELHLLTDSSPNYAETWSFLKGRLNDLEDYQRRNNGDVDPAQFLMQLASSTPVPSLASLGNMTNSIPVVAGLAVAQSLVEGAASLVMPQSFRVLPSQNGTPGSANETTANPSNSVVGTEASDYENPPTPPPSSR